MHKMFACQFVPILPKNLVPLAQEDYLIAFVDQ
jgi:hypothetical protein